MLNSSLDNIDLTKIKPKKHYENLKRNTHFYLDKIYKNNYAPRNKIGSCTFLFNELKPISYQDFFDKYTNFIQGNDKKYRGRSIEEIIIMAKDYQEKAIKKYPDNEFIQKMTFEDFFDLLVLHIIIETYDGHIAENYFKKMYEEKGFDVTEPNENDDAKMGIDFIVKTNEKTHFIQVKPRTFATSTSSTGYDRANHFEKEKLIKEKYGENASLEFIFYERGDNENDIKPYMVNKSGKIRFSLSDVCYPNGLTKYPSKKDFQKTFNLK